MIPGSRSCNEEGVSLSTKRGRRSGWARKPLLWEVIIQIITETRIHWSICTVLVRIFRSFGDLFWVLIRRSGFAEDASDVKVAATFIRYSDYIELYSLIGTSNTSHNGLRTLSLLLSTETSAWEWYS